MIHECVECAPIDRNSEAILKDMGDKSWMNACKQWSCCCQKTPPAPHYNESRGEQAYHPWKGNKCSINPLLTKEINQSLEKTPTTFLTNWEMRWSCSQLSGLRILLRQYWEQCIAQSSGKYWEICWDPNLASAEMKLSKSNFGQLALSFFDSRSRRISESNSKSLKEFVAPLLLSLVERDTFLCTLVGA